LNNNVRKSSPLITVNRFTVVSKKIKLALVKLNLIFFSLLFSTIALANIQANTAANTDFKQTLISKHLNGVWYSVSTYSVNLSTESFLKNPLQTDHLRATTNISHTGGHYVYVAKINIQQAGNYVLDFKNTSTIAQFKHSVYDQKNQLVTSLEGGIENSSLNPFFLRHGRELRLDVGQYTLATEIISPNFLAIPEPYIDYRAHYQQDIKSSNTLTLMALGVFLGLGIYYAVLAAYRNRLAEGMYASFILGNFLFNSATLLVLADVFGVHSLYWATMPILFSNIAYVVFVMALLEIKPENKKHLYWAGIVIFSCMCIFVGLALVYANWALELSRYGVGMFLIYGLTAAIIEAKRRNPTAKRYLIAISIFFGLGLATISLSKIDSQYTFYIEHMGLVSVSIEVIFLALVLSYQFSQLHRDKEQALVDLEVSVKTAHSDALTGLPNRHALSKDIIQLPMYGSLTFIDLDGLKFYNDTHGHERGDALLCSFADCYQHSLGADLKLYRLGGDEFAVLSPNGDLPKIESALTEALSAMRVVGFEFAGASAGSVFGYEAENVASLMRMADARMYENKRLRKSNQERSLQKEFKFGI